jgi:hypothetical protein
MDSEPTTNDRRPLDSKPVSQGIEVLSLRDFTGAQANRDSFLKLFKLDSFTDLFDD